MRGPRPDRLRAWWGASLAGLVPTAGLAGAGAGLCVDGRLGLGGGLVALAAGAAFLATRRGQRAIDRKFADVKKEGLARRFLLRTLVTRSRADLSLELQDAAVGLAGAERALLVCAGEGGPVLLGGDGDERRRAGEMGPALSALAALGTPVSRDTLLGASGAGAAVILELFDALDVSWAAPLVHRDLLIGVLLCGRFGETEGRAAGLELLASHASTALARALLEEARRAPARKATGLGPTALYALGPRGHEHTSGRAHVAWALDPIDEAGGDLVVVEPLDGGRVLVVAVDGVGRGAPAVLGAARVHGAVLARARMPGVTPEDLLLAADGALRADGATPVSALAAIVDANAREVAIASAGLPPPLLVEVRGGEPRTRAIAPGAGAGRRSLAPPPPRRSVSPTPARAPSEGALVGFGTSLGEAEGAPEIALVKVPLAPDDRLVIVTDGVLTAGAPYAHPLGPARLGTLLVALGDTEAARLPRAVLAEVARLNAGRPSADDRSVVVIRIAAPTETEEPAA